MEVSEAEKIIKNSFLFKDANEHIQLKEAISTVLQALEELQVEKNHLLLVDLSNEKKISNEENRRCMLLAIENNDLKEKVANSISKDKIKEKIEEQTKRIDKLLEDMIDKSTGCINVSYLSKKEKEEVIAKRNSLVVQKATLQQVKEELLKGE